MKVSCEEKSGVIHLRVVELDCVITRAGNCRTMRPYYYSENPIQLVMNMLQACIVSGNFQNSIEFCRFTNQIYVAIGGDKSDNDYVFVLRICNRKKGNAGIHCQLASFLKGPVCEEYTNAKKLIGNATYPTLSAFQKILNDSYRTLIFDGTDGEKKICSTAVFLAIPTLSPLTPRPFT